MTTATRPRSAPAAESNRPADLPLTYQSGFGNEFAIRSARRRRARGAELAAARSLRPLRRTDFGHGVHRAAQRQPPFVDVPHSPRRDARAVSHDRQRAHRERLRRRADAAQPAALGSVAAADGAHRFRRRPGHDGGQRRSGGDERLRHSPLRGESFDGRSLLLRRRRRTADRSAAGTLALRHRVRAHRRRAAGDRRHPARRALSRRAARRHRARLRLRELRRACCVCRISASSAPTASPIRAISSRRTRGSRTAKANSSSWRSSWATCGRPRSTTRRSTSSAGTATMRRTNTTCAASTRSARSASTIPIRRSFSCCRRQAIRRAWIRSTS